MVRCRGTQSEFLIAKILSAEINAQAEEAKVQVAVSIAQAAVLNAQAEEAKVQVAVSIAQAAVLNG